MIYYSRKNIFKGKKTVGMLWELSYREIYNERFFLNFFVLPPSKYISLSISTPVVQDEAVKIKGNEIKEKSVVIMLLLCNLNRKNLKGRIVSFNSSLKYLQSPSVKKNHSLRRKMKESETICADQRESINKL